MKTSLPDQNRNEAGRKVSDEDREHLKTLYEQYFPKVYNYFRYRLRDASLSDDLTARVFLKVVEHFPNYAPEKSSFSTWLFTIARNTLTDYYRTDGKHQPVPLEAADPVADGATDQETFILWQEERDILLAAVFRLKEREREIIALKFAVGLTNVAIARLTDLSESHVGVIVYRALARLREILADNL
ncbi:MAG: RNA polymerase sigma factor [Bacillota bacterium]|jgi:RNA polymerase sigma-70 factor (ECF subfamily)